jgi:hypothetical protein
MSDSRDQPPARAEDEHVEPGRAIAIKRNGVEAFFDDDLDR